MPILPPRACAVCGRLPCPGHPRSPAWSRVTHTPRIRGWRLQQLRAQLFEDQPLCVGCQAKGLVTVATIRDHIRPLAEGGLDVSENTQALCQICSDQKTQQESIRGMRRFHKPVR